MKQYACAVEIILIVGLQQVLTLCTVIAYSLLSFRCYHTYFLEIKTDAFTEISMNNQTDAYTETDLKG